MIFRFSQDRFLRLELVVVLFACITIPSLGATCTTTSTTTWDCGTPGSNDDLIINHDITFSGDFTLNTGSITVNSPNTITFDGDLTWNNGSTVLVQQGACINVLGNLLNKNNSGDIDIFGTLVVTGDFTNGSGSGTGAVINVGGTGTITIGGDCDNPGTVMNDEDSFTGCDNVILPVELLNFQATALISGNFLQWQTASERNNDFFQIQRSTNGQSWEAIGKINGAGNSDILLNYEFLDNHPLEGRNFYRLKQVDFDGMVEFSYIVSVITGDLPQLQVQGIYPNPTTGPLTIVYISDNQQPVTYQVLDVYGRLIKQGSYENQLGSSKRRLDLTDLNVGSYIIRLQNQSLILTEKVIKTR